MSQNEDVAPIAPVEIKEVETSMDSLTVESQESTESSETEDVSGEDTFEQIITKQPHVYVLTVDDMIICASFERETIQRELERHIRQLTVSFHTDGQVFVDASKVDRVVMTVQPKNYLFSSERVIATLSVDTIDFI